MLTIGIDGSNIRYGGGLTHLSQVIAHGEPEAAGIGTVHLWASRATLDAIADRPWLRKQHVPALDDHLVRRYLWRNNTLPDAVKDAGCDLLFAPGGILPRALQLPAVAMSQNMLPFERKEAARFGRASAMWWKLQLLRRAQARSFRQASGVLFLTEYARAEIGRCTGCQKPSAVVPHGIEDRFRYPPRPQRDPGTFTQAQPLQLLYVSIIDVYKHQGMVVQAVAQLRAAGMPVRLDLVGPANSINRHSLEARIRRADPDGAFITYHGNMSFDRLHDAYEAADAFVFASSCENLPNILLEAMAAGLPIASSNMGPMPEVLGEAGVYFDPVDSRSIAGAIRTLLDDPGLRARLAQQAYDRALAYSWTRCAADTFAFIAERALADGQIIRTRPRTALSRGRTTVPVTT